MTYKHLGTPASVLTLLALFAPPPAHATVGITVPDATYSAVLTIGNTSEPFTGSVTSTAILGFSLGGLVVGSGSGVLTTGTIEPNAAVLLGDGATLVHAPTLTASSTVNAASGGTANAVTQNELSYYFSIAGPASVNVPLIVYSNGGINYDGPFGDVSGELEGLASARLNIGGTGTGVDLGSEQLIVGFCASDDIGCTPETSVTTTPAGYTHVSVPSGFVDQIALVADSYISMDIPGDRLASAGIFATIDPYVMIDPSFPLASEFSLVFSPYIGNDLIGAASVPEPGTLTLLGSALLALAAVRRRTHRRRT